MTEGASENEVNDLHPSSDDSPTHGDAPTTTDKPDNHAQANAPTKGKKGNSHLNPKQSHDEPRGDLNKSKYRFIWKSISANELESERSGDYADFLKNLERKCSRIGYLDSSYYTRKYGPQHKSRDEGSPRSARARSDGSRSPHVWDVSKRRVRHNEEFQKRMKFVEGQMCQAKQEERELKRSEGDIIKTRGVIRRELKSYEKDIFDKQFDEDVTLNRENEKYAVVQRDYHYDRAHRNQERMKLASISDQDEKSGGRKYQLNIYHMSMMYRTKMDELNLKAVERDRIARDYERRLQLKEEEQKKLQRDLAEIASALMMEKMKAEHQIAETARAKNQRTESATSAERTAEIDLDDKLAKSGGAAKIADQTKKRLSADLSTRRASNAAALRERNRTIQSTRLQLTRNADHQHKLNESARQAKLDHKQQMIQQSLDEASVRRHDIQRAAREERSIDRETVYAERAKKRSQDLVRLHHVDSLRHFQRTVARGEEQEHSLYGRLKHADYERQRHDQAVRRLEQELVVARRDNGRRLHSELAGADRRERDIEEKLVRAKAQLEKMQTERDDTLGSLVRHRGHLSQERYRLQEFQRQHDWLQKVASSSPTGGMTQSVAAAHLPALPTSTAAEMAAAS